MKTSRDAPAQSRCQQLSAELRNERTQAGRTQKEVAQEMDWSASKMRRIESGTVRIKTTDLRALLSYYNVAGEQRTEELVDLVRATRTRTGRPRPQLQVANGGPQ
jgi:transcriptional regulator with XRE-family HTH domain